MTAELTLDLVRSLWLPQEVVLSPDASRAAWSAAPAGREGAEAESAIWMAKVDGVAPPRRWTRGGCDTRPGWSPDGLRIAFLAPDDPATRTSGASATGTTRRSTANAGPGTGCTWSTSTGASRSWSTPATVT